ncbi:CGH_1_collapsed_G0015360.mRNA.1.CDS.1 [Saccharomyces cerevisiae]|nr:CGH_1_collapsed_G0015360.mRNA.1.CDS.1 [Saccharomyces cerevisiae]
MGHVFPLETRPYNQGSRLTSYELFHHSIELELVQFQSKQHLLELHRIVRNGDTANKIGTLQLVVICKQFGIKFFVVAPKTTIDNVNKTGDTLLWKNVTP